MDLGFLLFGCAEGFGWWNRSCSESTPMRDGNTWVCLRGGDGNAILRDGRGASLYVFAFCAGRLRKVLN